MDCARLCQVRRSLAPASRSPVTLRDSGLLLSDAGSFGRSEELFCGAVWPGAAHEVPDTRKPKVLEQLNSGLQEPMVQALAQEVLEFTRSKLNTSIDLSERGVTFVDFEAFLFVCKFFSLFERG